ncbi:MAG: bacteriohemerythrin [bacterium]|nr:bacteriohemerythrin [bacterium]
MAIMTWGPQFEIGVTQVDIQHKKLVELMNKLHDGMVAGKGAEQTKVVLKELVDYTVYHFGFEEKFMQSINYPDYAAHKNVHNNITAKVKEMAAKAAGGSVAVQTELLRFLRDWLIDHIQNTDRKYAQHANKSATPAR